MAPSSPPPQVVDVVAPAPWRARAIKVTDCGNPDCTECADLPTCWFTFVAPPATDRWLCTRVTLGRSGVLMFGERAAATYRNALRVERAHHGSGHGVSWGEVLAGPADVAAVQGEAVGHLEIEPTLRGYTTAGRN